ncbi:G-box-binding factor 3 [Carex littledalei]|uniref:G-box-binding factor 3 n=1 Tax=Carex littledalei TaxID=544730 RepID=A0A833V0H6_9POAL|nr:G-box-binding factor 3 [Carex littledalei]
MDLEGKNSTETGHEEENKMEQELELDAAHALANLAGSDPISNQSSISEEDEPHQFQAKIGENSKEVEGNRCQNQTLDNMRPSTSINQGEVSSLRGQRNLNESERDAKRQRRILANRESARQTILRRQAFRDELARKVSILSAENMILKKEKENATREYFYQKEMNQQLKDQITPLKEEKTLQPPLSAPAPETPETLSIPAEVSCSLTLGIGVAKVKTVEQRHEAVTPKQKLNQLQSEDELKEGCAPYMPLDATNARRRRMEIARSKQLNRN